MSKSEAQLAILHFFIRGLECFLLIIFQASFVFIIGRSCFLRVLFLGFVCSLLRFGWEPRLVKLAFWWILFWSLHFIFQFHQLSFISDLTISLNRTFPFAALGLLFCYQNSIITCCFWSMKNSEWLSFREVFRLNLSRILVVSLGFFLSLSLRP